MPEITLQEKRLSLEPHHFKLLLLQWLWEHIFLKGTVAKMYTTIMLSPLPTRCWTFLCYQLLSISAKGNRVRKRKKKQPQHSPNPKVLQTSLPGSKIIQSNTDFSKAVKGAVKLWSSLSQRPQTHHNRLGHLFHLHTDQQNFLHFQGITKPSLLLLKSCESAYPNETNLLAFPVQYDLALT